MELCVDDLILVRVLNKSLYGLVWLAHFTRLDRAPQGGLADHPLVVVKISTLKKLNANRHNPENPVLETRIMQHLSTKDHVGVVKFYGCITTAEEFWQIFEYCPGGELFEIICLHGSLGERNTQAYFRQLLTTVTFLHEQRIAHMDISSENIIFDGKHNLKLIDFGMAQWMPEDSMLKTISGGKVSLYFSCITIR